MADVLQLFDKGAEIAGIKDDIAAIKGLVELGRKWEAAEWPDDLPSLEALLKQLAEDADSDAVKAAMDRLGLGEVRAGIAGLLAKVQAAGAALPAWVKTLATRLDAFGAGNDGALSWKPLDKDVKVPLGDDRFSLGLSGSFELGCAAAAEWDAMGDAGPLMRIGLDASVGAKAGATIPVNVFTIKGSANAEAALGLDCWFKPDAPGTLYGIELARRALQVPDPFSYAAVWEAFGHPGFMGTDYEFTASAGTSLEVSLGKLVDASQGLKLDLSAKVSVSADIKHKYAMTLRRGPDADGHATILAALSRSDTSNRALGVSVGVNIDLPILRARVQELVKDALAKWEEGLAAVQPFLSPGTYLQNAIGARIGTVAGKIVSDPALKAALTADLKGVFGIDTQNDSALVGWLKTAISGAVARRSAALISGPETVVEGVLADLEARLPASVRPLVEQEVDELVATAKAELDGVVTKLWDDYDNKAAALGKLLGKAGRGSDAAVASLDEAFKGVRELLEKCNTLVHEVAEKASAAVEKKVSIAVSLQATRSRELQVKISGRFLAGDGDAPAIFNEFVKGELAELAARIQNHAATPSVKPLGFELDGTSTVKLVESSALEAGYEVVMFGFGAGGSETITVEATAMLDADGNVQIDSQGSLERRFKGGGEERQISFADVLSVAVGRAAEGDSRPSVTSTIKLGVTLSYRDDEYTARKLDGFLVDLEDARARLIDAEKGADARARLASWIKPGEESVDAEIKAELWFDKEVARRMLRLNDVTPGMPRRDTGELKSGMKEEIANIGIDALETMGVVTRERLEGAYADFKFKFERDFDQQLPDDMVDTIVRLPYSAVKQMLPESGLHLGEERIKLFADAHVSLNGLVDIIDLGGQAYLASPPKLDGSPAKWTLKMYRDFQKRIVTGSKTWLRLNQQLLFFTADGINPSTIAFMLALERLAGDLEAPVTLSMTNYSDPDRPETVAL